MPLPNLWRCPHDSLICDRGTPCAPCTEDQEAAAARMTVHRRSCTKDTCWWCKSNTPPPPGRRLDGTPYPTI